MKKLIYTFALILLTLSFTACSPQDSLEDITNEILEEDKSTTPYSRKEKGGSKKKIRDEGSPF